MCLFAGCSRGVSFSPPGGSANRVDLAAQEAQRALNTVADAVDRGRSSAGRQGTARQIVTNAHTLGVHRLRLQYVDGDPADASAAVLARYGRNAWVGSVQVSYRLPDDVGPTSMEVAFVFVSHDDSTVTIAAVGGHGKRSALWLEGPIRIRRNAGALLIVVPGQPVDRYWRLARHAVRDVDGVLPKPRHRLVFEVPRDQAQLESLIDATPGSYRLIAGVTASIDGTIAPRTPLHSFLNPTQFDHLRGEGAQVVASHEATLQATHAPPTSMPTWAKEGFADYVALAHADISLRVAAHNIITRTLRSGPPSHLPTDDDFDPTDASLAGLNAVFESAWLAWRYIADTWGEARAIAVYDALTRGKTVDAAFRQLLGLDQREFVENWRAYLNAVAS
jgi:hypothetical protein